MLDIKWIRENVDEIKDAARKKHIDAERFIDQAVATDARRREITHEVEQLKANQNRIGKEIAQIQGDEKKARIVAMKEVADRVKELDGDLATIEEELHDQLLRIPNICAPEVPEGATDEENVELRRVGEIPVLDFEWKDHLTLGEELDLIDIPRAAKLAGSRTYILKNEAALLELAVLRFAVDHLVAKGFGPMVVPTLVRRKAMEGTAYFPGGEEQAYTCEKDELYLVGTSEVPVTSYHCDEILSEDELPRRYAGISTCYRREAGAAGRDTKGLYRIHQFNKVEQVIISTNDEEESKRQHDFILQNAEEILQALELPYRVVNVCGGDLGAGQVQKYDIETWMPSRENYGETHSASRFHDFQARRLNLRYRDADKKVRYCHTLNNTAIASPRILIPLLEVHQQPDGRIRIPEALRPYLGGLEFIQKKSS
jgi:seryl-tRNA synthetase